MNAADAFASTRARACGSQNDAKTNAFENLSAAVSGGGILFVVGLLLVVILIPVGGGGI